ncbi:imelysin family protein, partial [Pseudorhodobacter sp.]|uniref:imelysin family protein n=1 Tax=Pseudorhodobacter sp. TaxID=1934400 RepID=UPI00264A402A
MRLIAFALLFLPLPALADAVVDRVVDDVALPAVTRFADVTGHLAEAAQSDCTATSADLVTAWNDAMDVWFAVQPLRTGPLEDAALRQSIAYWPDTQGHRQ